METDLASDAAAREAAISDILRVISDSPGDVQPVFDTILDHAIRLCSGNVASLWQYDGDKLRFAAARNATPEAIAVSRANPLELGDWNPTPQAALERRVFNVLDVFANPKYRPLIPAGTSGKRPNAGTVLAVPLVRGDELFGVMTIWRYEKRLFSEREVDLVRTFTAQAVIAIQNVRLFHETRAALERQTATAEVLTVISSSPTNVQPVFDVIVQSAVQLCGARFGRVYRYDGSTIDIVASHGLSTGGLGQVQRVFPRPAAQDTIVGQAILAREPRLVHDVQGDQSVPPLSRQMIEALGTRSQVTMPMIHAGRPIGAITIGWDQPGGFNDKQIALLRTFADQAVIAIENVRLFNETREALERQTATADILKVIASSPSDVRPVFEAIV